MLAEDMGSGEDGGGGRGRLCGLESQLCYGLITLHKLLNLSVPQFTHYKMGMLSYVSLMKLL